ncbi:MAG: metal ABC transporter ATP-binding protein [Alphaproteobacteria bacterium GM202ARS2]|nr:metal ABC transporter ATP-binding protein [Alphaproteobacteria bacterium GM202ARS2]
MSEVRPILTLEHVWAGYPHAPPVLENICYQSPLPRDGKGHAIAIIGPNGAGKTTLLKVLAALLPVSAGAITLFGMPLTAERVADKVAYVPQHHTIDARFPTTPLDIVLMGLYRRIGFARRIKDHHKQEAMLALEQVRMHQHAHAPYGTLSGGQKQRVFIARALVSRAQLYLMDEPLNGIDKEGHAIILDSFHRITQQGGLLLCVHHALATVKEHFSHALLLNKTLIKDGTSIDVCQDETLKQAYIS